MNILDTTIRDGSYAVDFKFSLKDVNDLVTKLCRIGIKYIEIGHGLGLNASSIEHGVALHTDEEYMDEAQSVVQNSKLGCFCIPSIARLEDIELAKKHKMEFIRIGVLIQNYRDALPFIKKCQHNELEVFVNFMKTYSSPPQEFAKVARIMYEEGVSCVYIVDSAGSMNVKDLDQYINETRMLSDIKMGFHGHNNLGLAISNSLHCIEQGLDFIDCSFQGLGRSMGNASLEQFAMVLEKNGYDTGFDIPMLVEYGYAGLKNIVKDKLINPLDYICGYASFHSSFLKDIYRCCLEKKVDPLRLIIAYSQDNKMTMDYNKLCQVADSLPIDTLDNPYSFSEFFADRYKDF